MYQCSLTDYFVVNASAVSSCGLVTCAFSVDRDITYSLRCAKTCIAKAKRLQTSYSREYTFLTQIAPDTRWLQVSSSAAHSERCV